MVIIIHDFLRQLPAFFAILLFERICAKNLKDKNQTGEIDQLTAGIEKMDQRNLMQPFFIEAGFEHWYIDYDYEVITWVS